MEDVCVISAFVAWQVPLLFLLFFLIVEDLIIVFRISLFT